MGNAQVHLRVRTPTSDVVNARATKSPLCRPRIEVAILRAARLRRAVEVLDFRPYNR